MLMDENCSLENSRNRFEIVIVQVEMSHRRTAVYQLLTSTIYDGRIWQAGVHLLHTEEDYRAGRRHRHVPRTLVLTRPGSWLIGLALGGLRQIVKHGG